MSFFHEPFPPPPFHPHTLPPFSLRWLLTFIRYGQFLLQVTSQLLIIHRFRSGRSQCRSSCCHSSESPKYTRPNSRYTLPKHALVKNPTGIYTETSNPTKEGLNVPNKKINSCSFCYKYLVKISISPSVSLRRENLQCGYENGFNKSSEQQK